MSCEWPARTGAGDRACSDAGRAHALVGVPEGALAKPRSRRLPERRGLEAPCAADAEDGILVDKSHLILDRDAKYSTDWRAFIEEQGIEVIRLPPRSPNLNAYAERFVRSIKEECLDRMIFIGEASLRRAVREFMAHYHAERNHQGLGNRLIGAEPSISSQRPVERRIRFGGMLSFYHHAAT